MARGRDDDRHDFPKSRNFGKEFEDSRRDSSGDAAPSARGLFRDENPRGDSLNRGGLTRWGAPADRLLLPQGQQRETVTANHRTYRLRGSETDLLAVVGAFRVVPERDLATGRSGPVSLESELRRLTAEGLVERRTIPINHDPTRIVVLTEEGKALLNEHRNDAGERPQSYYAGLVKRRDLAHDAQLYRLFRTEADAIEGRGGRIVRIVLDAELRRDYQGYLNPPGSNRDHRATQLRSDPLEIAAFARAHELRIVDGRLQLPDLRIEYELDGSLERRDLELVTEHYSRGHVATKVRAGFATYRAAGGSGSGGGSAADPHLLRRLV